MLFDDCGRVPQVLMVSATTIRDDIPYDSACALDKGDHPFIQHASYIAYRQIRMDSVAHVEQWSILLRGLHESRANRDF